MGAIRGLCRFGKIYELGRFAPNLYLTFGRRLLGTFTCGPYSLFWFFVLGGREASRRRVRDDTARRYCDESVCVCVCVCVCGCVGVCVCVCVCVCVYVHQLALELTLSLKW